MIYCPDIEKLVRIDGTSTYAREGDCEITPQWCKQDGDNASHWKMKEYH